jgi:hypothetical protein
MFAYIKTQSKTPNLHDWNEKNIYIIYIYTEIYYTSYSNKTHYKCCYLEVHCTLLAAKVDNAIPTQAYLATYIYYSHLLLLLINTTNYDQ